MAKTPCSHCRGLGSIPGQGTRSYTTTRSSNAATKDPACHEEEQRCRVPQPSPDAAKQRYKQEKKGAKLANNEITLTNSPKSFSCFDIVLWLHKMLLLGERDEGHPGLPYTFYTTSSSFISISKLKVKEKASGCRPCTWTFCFLNWSRLPASRALAYLWASPCPQMRTPDKGGSIVLLTQLSRDSRVLDLTRGVEFTHVCTRCSFIKYLPREHPLCARPMPRLG